MAKSLKKSLKIEIDCRSANENPGLNPQVSRRLYRFYKLVEPVFLRDNLILLLIGEELKSHKFFSALRKLGLDDAFYQTDLSTYILNHTGFDAEQDAVVDRYFHLLSHYSEQLEATRASVRDCAFGFYVNLVA